MNGDADPAHNESRRAGDSPPYLEGHMDYQQMKQVLSECADLAGLDQASIELLAERGSQQHYEHDQVIYAEGARLDHSFGLLLAGDLIVEAGGTITGSIIEQQVFGEMAYFTNQRVRTATVRVGSSEAVILRFSLTPAELASAELTGLRRFLFLRTWNRFVSTSQNGTEEMVLVE